MNEGGHSVKDFPAQSARQFGGGLLYNKKQKQNRGPKFTSSCIFLFFEKYARKCTKLYYYCALLCIIIPSAKHRMRKFWFQGNTRTLESEGGRLHPPGGLTHSPRCKTNAHSIPWGLAGWSGWYGSPSSPLHSKKSHGWRSLLTLSIAADKYIRRSAYSFA